ncbi:unnamed protein product [Fusarium graminearum]|uniref:Uncharacterized protein n=1 Tax=Gibberella zeae TaxID=5518 RepID=A0A4E9DGC4_GIBZA|nr:unnamed protein product [Fusarium graminearum]CAG2000014.1 unnamed protein product [Fusarium graminearum]CAG2013599.1 unnamed protein product [Fusarium graminearum]
MDEILFARYFESPLRKARGAAQKPPQTFCPRSNHIPHQPSGPVEAIPGASNGFSDQTGL